MSAARSSPTAAVKGRVADEVGEEEGVVGDDHRLKGVTKR
jgi:hypothetical protein